MENHGKSQFSWVNPLFLWVNPLFHGIFMGKSTISMGDHKNHHGYREVDFEFYRFSLSEGTLELDDLYLGPLGRWGWNSTVVTFWDTKGYQETGKP
jgi:hypothetical protein